MAKPNKKTKTSGHKIGLHIRVSTEEQAENPEGSIRNQEERLRTTVKLKNMEGHFGDIHAVYIDRAKSGKDTKRPELQKLLQAIRSREISLVMVSELSRISRSIKDFSEIWEMMQQHDCGFQSLRENFDTTTAAGEMLLFTVANIAQFERRQISERVAANFNARAQRGLFNGGAIPFGYKRMEGKPGYLEIEEPAANVVREAFRAYIREGHLMGAARWLNEHGYRMAKVREGGGPKFRRGIFTVDILHNMLRNCTYVGIKTYHQKGELKEAEAVWQPIIDRELFEEVNQRLKTNRAHCKTGMKNRFPFLLSGLVNCKACDSRLVGKGAHGRRAKIPYYEHSWATKLGTHYPMRQHPCHGYRKYRVLARPLENIAWDAVTTLLTSESMASELLAEARKSHQLSPGSKEIDKCRKSIFAANEQLETLAERLAALPKTVAATPIFAQMEKLEALKRQAEKTIAELTTLGASTDEPAELKDYSLFLTTLREMLKTNDTPAFRAFIARTLIKSIHYGCSRFIVGC